ncbi:hypothetical protein RND81_06G230300 [Saponaria officinalis]|uniref:YbaK/aminoacyl-tRNA synthetase-associated domain-containing protein n=1 Tax=Saponaria officinalis TaxID=3572 RepID=A0AAW1KEQ1_SAPOF
MEEIKKLETLQTKILQRISFLELAFPSSNTNHPTSLSTAAAAADDDATAERLSAILRSNAVADFDFKAVPADYYDRPLEVRRDLLGAASIHHLCKSIVLVNTQAPSHIVDCSNRNNSKYYIVVVQYTARFSADMVKNYLYSINDGKVPKKKFNLRLAPEEISNSLTGFGHNAVTCIGMKTDIPVILDEAIVKLSPDYFWLGGGEVYLKMGVRTSEFIRFTKPFIFSCSTA